MDKTKLAMLNGVEKVEVTIPVHGVEVNGKMLNGYLDDGDMVGWTLDKINDCGIRVERPGAYGMYENLMPSDKNIRKIREWARDAQRLNADFIKKIREDLKITGDDQFGAMCDYIKDLHARKNADYGNVFSEIFKKRGFNYAMGHIEEKVSRIDSISKNGNKVQGEKLEDSLVDLACYALMTAIELRNSDVERFKNGKEVWGNGMQER